MLKSIKIRETDTICPNYLVILRRKQYYCRNEIYTILDKSYALRDDTATDYSL